jgi:hypothetical protein
MEVDELVLLAGSRVRRRRVAVTATTAGLVAAVVVGALAVRGGQPRELEPAPTPSPSPSPSRAVDLTGTRPLVYAEGSTVHIGDKTVEARKPVAFIDATDDGAVYEASLDGRLWFSDGTTTSMIGESGFTAAPTAHAGVVATGNVGSLVVWQDATGRENDPSDELVVYDTSRHAEVGRIRLTDDYEQVLYVDENHVYFTPPSASGCWALGVHDIHPCKNPHLYRYDVTSGATTKIALADLDAEMGARVRMFERDPRGNEPGFVEGSDFSQVGSRLVTSSGGDPTHVTLTNGDEVRLRLPGGYRVPGLERGESVIGTSQWLDDGHVVVWAKQGGGDLPPQHGDLLVCPLPDGVCRVVVPESSALYVAP